MDKMEQRNPRYDKLIYFITIPLSILLLISNIYFINTNYTLKNVLEENTKIKNDKEKEYNNNVNEIKLIEDELNKIKNIDNEIENVRNDYYKSLKTFEDKVSNKELDYKIAYLTFDDGPYYLTHKYLEVLEKYDVRATFFTIGLDKDRCFDDRSKSCKDLYAKEAHYGHTMANHTYSHLIFNGLYSSTDSFIKQVQKQEKLIKDRTGVTTNIVRFPGGIGSSGSLRKGITKRLMELGYGWVDWSASNGDGGWVGDKDTALKNLKSTIDEDIEVILFHDYSYATLAALPDAIEYLRDNKYVLLPLFYESKMVSK